MTNNHSRWLRRNKICLKYILNRILQREQITKSKRERSEAGYINDEADKKEAVSLAEPVLLHRGRSNEAINRLFELRIACKCLLLVTFDAYYAREFTFKKKKRFFCA